MDRGLKIGTVFKPVPIKIADYCVNNNGTWTVKSDIQAKYNISYCCTGSCDSQGDYWAGAVTTCKDSGGHLATATDLATIAAYLYDAPSRIGESATYGFNDGAQRLNTSRLGTTFAGLGSSWSDLWSFSLSSVSSAYIRVFYNSYTYSSASSRGSSKYMAVCVK